jgi:hypothetical protein
MTSPYYFALLYPAHHPLSGANDALLGACTLGIEVTEPVLAARCGLGCIDPQHGPRPEQSRAAIDLALDWPLPPPGSLLATQKADSDALGAMAVLVLRQAGHDFSGEALARVKLLSRWDRFAHGNWVEWQSRHPPLPHPAHSLDSATPREIKAIRALAGNRALPLDARVAALGDWLAKGQLPLSALTDATTFEKELLAQWNAGDIRLFGTSDPRLVQMQANVPTGLFLAYRHAPVVLAESTGDERRLTVAQFEPGWIDMPRLLSELSAQEPGWGGSRTLIASPQGAATRLSADGVKAGILACLGPNSMGV